MFPEALVLLLASTHVYCAPAGCAGKRLQTKTQCGTPTKAISGRIVGGQEAVPHSWPWQVRIITGNLRHSSGSVAVSQCGGTIIHNNWVLTAAHCVTTSGTNTVAPADHVNVVAAKHDISQLYLDEILRLVVDRVIMHENYNYTPGLAPANDIALLHLSTPLNFTNNVKPVCLPKDAQSTPTPTDKCYSTGWGKVQGTDDGESSDVLKQAKMSVLTKSQCPAPYVVNFDTQLCADAAHADGVTCQGDSGGPLVCEQADTPGRWTLHGVTSYGDTNCNLLQAFTKVAAYIEWISCSTANLKANTRSALMQQL